MLPQHFYENVFCDFAQYDSVSTPSGGMYCCAKAGVGMLTKVMATELSGHGIRVNTVRPGLTNTEFVQGLSNKDYETVSAPFLQRMLIRRLIESKEV